MFTSIEQFKNVWQQESNSTRKVMEKLSDEILIIEVAEGFRNIGRMAWHIVLTIPDMARRMGLAGDGPEENAPVPKGASEIKSTYDRVASSLLEHVTANWRDETLLVEDDMFGEKWKRGTSLYGLLRHEIHHRAQLVVLLRQAGVAVPGVYGPAKEEWAQFGMQPPEV